MIEFTNVYTTIVTESEALPTSLGEFILPIIISKENGFKGTMMKQHIHYHLKINAINF